MKRGKTEKKKGKSQKKAKNPAKIPVGGRQKSSFGQKKPLLLQQPRNTSVRDRFLCILAICTRLFRLPFHLTR